VLLAVGAVALGAMVQGVSGVGGGFISVPMLALINMSFLPGPLVFGSLVLSGLMAWRERAYVDSAHITPILLATVPGAVLGAWLLSTIAVDKLGLLFGGVILFAVVLSLLGLQLRLTRVSGSLAGFLAGAMGASTGIGAPVIAVLYQHVSGPALRATLALLYTVASVLIVICLAAFGRFDAAEAGYALLLVPGFLLGYLCSRPLALYFDHGATRYVVLGVSATASLSLIVNSL
jgi:uncharacterized membrane protein YfcA